MSSININKIFLYLICLIILTIPTMSLAKDTPNNSGDWWNGDKLVSEGHGISKNKDEAKKIATENARQQLSKQVAAIYITPGNALTVEDVQTIVNNAQITSEDYDEQGNCTVTLSVPLYGAENSVTKTAFKPIVKENFPAPTNKNISVEGNYTGLIIDCTDWEIANGEMLNPVLAPVIKTASNLPVYVYNNLDYNVAVEKGVVNYFTYIESAENSGRVGDNPLIVKVTALQDNFSNLIISADDSDKILCENQISHFLDSGNVAVISFNVKTGDDNYRGQGIRGVRDNRSNHGIRSVHG